MGGNVGGGVRGRRPQAEMVRGWQAKRTWVSPSLFVKDFFSSFSWFLKKVEINHKLH